MKNNIILILFVFYIIGASASPIFALSQEQEAEALNVGKKLIFEGKIDEGLKVLEEAAGEGKNANIMYYLAKGNSWKGNYGKAIEYYGWVQSAAKTDDVIYWQAQFGIAQVTSWQNKFDEAIILYNKILTDYKKIPVYLTRETYIAIGDVYSWKLEISKAIEYFNKALESDPQSVTALNRIAKVYLWSKNYKESKKYSQMALAIDKNDIEAKNRVESLDLSWNYSVTLGDTYTYFDADNLKGDKVKRNITMATFDWPVRENFGLHFESSYLSQNSAETSDPDKASKWTSDINAGIGINGNVFENTYYTILFNYTFNAMILPDWTGETDLSQKISKNFDLLFEYKLLYDSKFRDEKKESAYTHSISAGGIYYISENVYSQLQFFFETDGNDKLFSVLFHQTINFTSRDKTEIYLSYGKGTNYLISPDSNISLNVTTTGIALSHTHFFTSKFGLKPTIEYNDRVNYYDISFGIQAIYNI